MVICCHFPVVSKIIAKNRKCCLPFDERCSAKLGPMFTGGSHVVLILSSSVKRQESRKVGLLSSSVSPCKPSACISFSCATAGQCFLSDVELVAMILICLDGCLSCSTFFCLLRCLRVLLAAIWCVCGFMFLHICPMRDVIS